MENELNPIGTSDLDNAIKTSQDRLNNLKDDALPKENPSQVPKRKKGRQVGWRKHKPSVESSTPNSGGDPRPLGAAAVNPQVMRNFEVTPLASEVVKLPFDFVGAAQGVDITPTDIEAKTPAEYLAKCIDAHLPGLDQRDPKTFNFVAFLIAYALLVIKKSRVVLAHKKNKAQQDQGAENNQKPQDNSTPQAQTRPLPANSVSASEYFNQGNRVI